MDYSDHSAYRNEDYSNNYSYPRVTSRQSQPYDHPSRDYNNGAPSRDRSTKNLPPKYFEIQPYLDRILKDQTTDNKEVQHDLQDLKSINDRLISDLGGNRYSKEGQHLQGGLWDQIQRLIRQIIDNSEGEAEDFKANLQHLKNLNNRTLNQDLGYHDTEHGQYSRHYRRDKGERANGRDKVGSKRYRPQRDGYQHHSNRPFSDTFEPRTQNQRRLMDEIRHLKQENRHLKERLREEVDRNRALTYQLEDLEEQSSYRNQSNYRGGDRNRERIASRGGQYDEGRETDYLNRLNQQIRSTQQESNVLRKQLKGLRHQRGGHRGSIEDMKQHLGQLGNYVAASQRRAAQYETLKNNQQEVLDELNRMKHGGRQNGLSKAKSQPRYKNYSDDQRIRNLQTSLAQNRNQSSYRREERNGRERHNRNGSQYY